MALWNDQAKGKDDSPARAPSAAQSGGGRSVIDAGLSFEGRIEGSGDILIAGQFNGDIDIRGNLTIEAGAKLTGSVSAQNVSIAGELDGNVTSAKSVELLPSAVVNGDVTAGSLTVAAGSKMRGRADFGWNEAPAGAKAAQPGKANPAAADKGRESAA